MIDLHYIKMAKNAKTEYYVAEIVGAKPTTSWLENKHSHSYSTKPQPFDQSKCPHSVPFRLMSELFGFKSKLCTLAKFSSDGDLFVLLH